jgi:hypothetical protein
MQQQKTLIRLLTKPHPRFIKIHLPPREGFGVVSLPPASWFVTIAKKIIPLSP